MWDLKYFIVFFIFVVVVVVSGGVYVLCMCVVCMCVVCVCVCCTRLELCLSLLKKNNKAFHFETNTGSCPVLKL